MPKSLTLTALTAACFLLSTIQPLLSQVQEWAYHHPEHLDHSHILVDPAWSTQRVVAAVTHTHLGSGTASSTTATPQGGSIIMRQKENGDIVWQNRLDAAFLVRISDMKVVPGNNGGIIAAVGHIRLSNTGTFSDRGLMLLLDASTGALIDQYILEGTDQTNPYDSRLLGLDFYMFQEQMHIACTGWSGDVTSTSGGHKGLYVRALVGPSGFSFQGAMEFDSPDGGVDYDFLSKVVNDGAGMLVIGSINQYAYNSDPWQGALVARMNYDGSFLWGRTYWEPSGSTSDVGVVAADILALPDKPLLLALNHLKDQKYSISTINPADGVPQVMYTVDVNSTVSNTQIIKAFDLESDGTADGFVLGGYLHQHFWTNAMGAHDGNVPFRMTGTVGDFSPTYGDLQVFRVPSKNAGETVNNWAYAPFPNDRYQPFVYHPEMLEIEAGNDPDIDFLLTGYRERVAPTDKFDLDIIPTDAAGTYGPCEAVSISPIVAAHNASSFPIPDPSATTLFLDSTYMETSAISLDTLGCGELSAPFCSLPDTVEGLADCLDVDFEAVGGFTPPPDVHYTWDFGDGSPTVSGTDLKFPPTHTYPAAGTYTVSVTTYCVWDPTTTVTAFGNQTVEECPACDIGPYTINFWLYCGAGCWGLPGTRSAVSLDATLWNLDEAQYDAEVAFSDGTSYTLDLNNARSLIKCFPSVPFFKSACLRIYEEGGLAAGDSPCYEVCASDACIDIEIIPEELFGQLAPNLNLDEEVCKLNATAIPSQVTTDVSLFLYNDTYPGGDDENAFLAAFLQGETFPQNVVSNYQPAGDYSPTSIATGSPLCYQVQEATVTHPVVLHIPDENGGQLYHDGQPVGPEFVDANPTAVVLSDPRLSLAGALITDGPVDILAQANQQPQVAFEAEFFNLIPLDASVYSGGVNAWSLANTVGGSADPGGDDILTTTPTSADDVCGLPIGDLGIQYDQGFLGMISLAPAQLGGNGGWHDLFTGGHVPLIEPDYGGQVTCPAEYSYLAEFRADLLSPSCEANGISDLSGNEGECNFSANWTETGEYAQHSFAATQLLVTDGIRAEAAGATYFELELEFIENYNDGMGSEGQWTISNTEGEVVVSGMIPSNVSGYIEDISLPVGGSFVFEIVADCWASYDRTQVMLSLNNAGNLQPIVLFPAGTMVPGPVSSGFHLPDGIVIVPPTTPIDTTCDVSYTHELMTPGMQPYSPPGAYVDMENGIQLGYEVFFDGAATHYNSAAVVTAAPTVGSGQVLSLSNINAVYDFSAFPNVSKVSFNFFDGAGVENLKVNGHTLLVDEFEFMPTTVAPGVTMTVATAAHPGYQVGLVTLTGNVQKLEVGGQQFYLDDVCVVHDGTVLPVATGSCAAQCDVETDFDMLTAGDRYGDIAQGANIAVAPGNFATTSGIVPIYLEPLFELPTPNQYYSFLGTSPDPSGTGLELWTNNITAQFDIQDVVAVTDTVCISFRDEGGFENLWINNAAPQTSPGGYGGLAVFNGAVIGGVTVQVTGSNVGFAYEGTITLIGDVDKFSIGGQELFLDDLCISGDDGSANATCDVSAAFGMAELDGECNYTFVAPPSDALLQWSLDGNPLGLANASFINLGFPPGAHEVCLTATDPDDASCTATQCMTVSCVPGCTDVTASNYNPEATEDDGSCIPAPTYCLSPTMDGYLYDVVLIGDKCWFSENLRTTHYADGSPIPGNVEDATWTNTTQGASAVYGEGGSGCASLSPDFDACSEAAALDAYGRLYNWHAVMDNRQICPAGWRTPTDADFIELAIAGGMDPADFTPDIYDVFAITEGVGTALKSTSGWANDGNGTDLLGFTALPAGYRNAYSGNFQEAGERGIFWTSTFNSEYNNPWTWSLSAQFTDISRATALQEGGYSVRCIKDIITPGCTSPDYAEYNPGANVDDGSCQQIILTNEACNIECDGLTDFDSDLSGASWGDSGSGASVHVNPGGFAFTSGDFDVYADALPPVSGPAAPTYNQMTTETAGLVGVGRVLKLNNIIAEFDVQSAVPVTDSLCLVVRAAGNNTRITVNGASLAISDLSQMAGWHGAILGGCELFLAAFPETSANGSVVAVNAVIGIVGDVDMLAFGGDECMIDDICVSAGDGCPDTDADGICDQDEVAGCTDASADNYNPEATDDDGSCEYGGGSIVLTVPPDVQLYANGPCDTDVSPNSTGMATAEYPDGCDAANATLTYTDAELGPPGTGCYTIIRTWSAQCGSEVVTGEQLIQVIDDIAPTIEGEVNVTLECDQWEGCSFEQMQALGLIAISDNCDLQHAEVVCETTSGACYDGYILTYTAMDHCGNVSTFEQVVNIVDETPPAIAITCPNDTTVSLTCDALPVDETAWINFIVGISGGLADFTLVDNCHPAPGMFTYSEVAILAECEDYILVQRDMIAIAQDTCGNQSSATCAQMVTVITDCPGDPVPGCTDPSAPNYWPEATQDDGSCLVPGCTYAEASNFDAAAQFDDGSCAFVLTNPCPTDINVDGETNTQDLLLLLGNFGLVCGE